MIDTPVPPATTLALTPELIAVINSLLVNMQHGKIAIVVRDGQFFAFSCEKSYLWTHKGLKNR